MTCCRRLETDGERISSLQSLAANPIMIEVILYTKSGCHLCEAAKEMLGRLTAVHPHHLTEIDIAQDPAIFARYHYIIPVVHIGDRKLQAPITAAQLEAALRDAGRPCKLSHE